MVQDILLPVSFVGTLGLVFGLGLSYASKIFGIKVDKRIEEIREILPGANCAACGVTGCDAFADAVVEGKCDVDACIVGGDEVTAKICEIMGVETKKTVPKIARVLCNGSNNSIRLKYEYAGIDDCVAASALYAGPLSCSYGCIGLGTCKNVCQFDAIVVENGIAKIIESRCTSCGKCVEACPKNIVKLVPQTSNYTVLCRSLDKGAVVRKNCEVGCIGCRRCEKVCISNAISFEGTLAKIDTDKCSNCGECKKVCPTGVIDYFFPLTNTCQNTH